MYRSVLLAISGLFTLGCLDDQLELDGHYLRSAADESAGDETRSAAPSTDGGATLTPGKTVKLGNATSFLAVDRDFEGFQSWSSVDLGKGQHVVDQTGHKRVYINALPQPGDDEFRVGTMLVKVLELGEDVTSWQVHAMVKRGGSYNVDGAYGWEYFDFTLNEEGIPRQNWRGETAPDGESYQTTVFTADGTELQDVPDCNTCHQTANNDAVNTPALDLDLWQ